MDCLKQSSQGKCCYEGENIIPAGFYLIDGMRKEGVNYS